jgi:hypothetical protein
MKLELLFEEIFNNLATVYHRDKNKDGKIFVQKGNQRSAVALFGGGLYTTYDLKSQFTERMIKNYGNFIYKLKVNINGFFIFDKKLRDSLSRIYSKKQDEVIATIESIAENDDEFNKWDDSETQIYVVNKYHEIYDLIRQNFNGIIYNSKDDGKCCLIFDPNKSKTKIMSVANAPTIESIDKLKWE